MRLDRKNGLDHAKLIAAFLVICVHTSPLFSFSLPADFILTRIIARVAVAFFLMVSAYMLLPQYLFGKSKDYRPINRFLKKTLLLYAIATALYLPISIYAGYFSELNPLRLLKLLLFDGSFYHLWYLPATLIGVLLVLFLCWKLPFRAVMGIVLLLYGIGLLGDSYFGLCERIPNLSSLYEIGFTLFSYTRNGLFYAPIFLLMGACLGGKWKPMSKKGCILGIAFSVFAMIAEGLTLHALNWQRHDSMYLTLLPCMFFLFQLILAWPKGQARQLRQIATWIYLLHPLMIIGVRGLSKVLGLGILLENSLLNYALVCMASFACSVVLVKLLVWRRKGIFPTARAWIELDGENLRHNVEMLRTMLPDSCQLMPAVKANAYGHGAVLLAKELNQLGIRAFCVASVTEGVELRKKRVKGDILVLGYTHPEQFCLLRRYSLTQTVLDLPYAKALDGYGKSLRVHVAIDTGMHRLGERCERVDAISQILSLQNLRVTGMFTHLCTDGAKSLEDKAFSMGQIQAFGQTLTQLEALGHTLPKKHLLASSGVLHYPEWVGDYARVGLAVYGILDQQEAEELAVDLRPVLSLKARVVLVKDLFKGEHAGYGLQFTAEQDGKLAVLSIGYADGLPCALSCAVGRVLIHGYEAPIVGRVCMDQTLIDVSHIAGVQAGDEAVIIGRSGTKEISACALAKQAGTIPNEIISGLGSRLERIMVNAGHYGSKR